MEFGIYVYNEVDGEARKKSGRVPYYEIKKRALVELEWILQNYSRIVLENYVKIPEVAARLAYSLLRVQVSHRQKRQAIFDFYSHPEVINKLKEIMRPLRDQYENENDFDKALAEWRKAIDERIRELSLSSEK